jgi:hypothetical protein
MQHIIDCRTPVFGGEVYFCESCHEFRYSYHSCKDRHCPKCGNDNNGAWLAQQRAMLLPTPYFLVTFTVPHTLRAVVLRYPILCYSAMFHAAAETMLTLGRDPKYIGGQLGFFGVLHTWQRTLDFHSHLHFIVAGGGLSDDGNVWLPAQNKFFLPVHAMSIIFRAKLRDALKKEAELFEQIPPDVWNQIKKKKKKRKKRWVVHCKPVGSGEHAVEYLSRYVFRVALSNASLQKMVNGNVTFRYQERETKQYKIRTVTAEEFIRLFLQHVLPLGFCKVRYYGFLSARHRPRLQKIRELLNTGFVTNEIIKAKSAKNQSISENNAERKENTLAFRVLYCPKCKGEMQWRNTIQPTRTRAP